MHPVRFEVHDTLVEETLHECHWVYVEVVLGCEILYLLDEPGLVKGSLLDVHLDDEAS